MLSNTLFNILLHIGEHWFQYYLILPEHLADSDYDDADHQPRKGRPEEPERHGPSKPEGEPCQGRSDFMISFMISVENIFHMKS